MFQLNSLPFKKNDLEPYISERTLEFHYGKHHQGYINKLNNLTKKTKLEKLGLIEIIRATHNKKDEQKIFNNAAQVFNHDFFWKSLDKFGGGKPEESILTKLEENFESYEKFCETFKQTALDRFGSGWVWLIEEKGKLKIINTLNAETPVANPETKPLVTLDVWEHAYYLDYQNQRGEFIDNFLENLLNWKFVKENLKK